MPDRFSAKILSHLSDSRYKPLRPEGLADELGIASDDADEFQQSVRSLIDAGQVVISPSQSIGLPPPGRTMIGSFRLNDRGFGFIIPDSPTEHGDLFVPAQNVNGAMTGDRVKAKVIHEGNRGGPGQEKSPYIGLIVEIVQRSDRKYVGNLQKIGSHWVVVADGKSLRDPIRIGDPGAKNAKLGDKVCVELLQYPTPDAPANGVIIEVLGEQGQPDVETLAVMRAFGLPDEFPSQVFDDARAAAAAFSDQSVPPDREDLTNDFILTIDPPDARDYDDAISIRKLNSEYETASSDTGEPSADGPSQSASIGNSGGGNSGGGATGELGVHIADVAHFVQPGSPLDVEASRRGNSTYLPRKVVPMLPEMLSNGVCSLQEGVNRFCKSCFIRFDDAGKVMGARFARTVIRSAKRLTYLEAQALIDGDLREATKHAKTEPKYPRILMQKLQLMNELSHIIRARRLEQGMIVLGLPDVELIFDDYGRVVDAQPEDSSWTHTLIEMFMVEANEAAARVFDRYQVPMVRRTHPDPPVHDLTSLKQFARVAGFNIPARPSRKELQALLEAVRGKPAQHAVHLAVLRTLSKAEYSTLLVGHFALASEHYTHFTSPIRRYADLLVHRGLDAYMDAVTKAKQGRIADGTERAQNAPPPKRVVAKLITDDPRVPDEEKLNAICSRISLTERNSESAEKDLRAFLVLDLLAEHLGDDFEGTVTGVTAMGLFMQLDRYLIDGFVKITDLPGDATDRWRLNRTTGAMVAMRSGKAIAVGDRFTVRVANVNPVKRTLELVIVEALSTAGSAPNRRPQEAPATPWVKKKHAAEAPASPRKSHKEALRLKQQRRSQKKRKKRGP